MSDENSTDGFPYEQPPEQLVRRPEVLYTKGFLDNPIEFAPDEGVFSEVPDANVVEGRPPEFERDIPGFKVVVVNTLEDTKYLSIPILTGYYTRERFEAVFDDREFEEID